VITALYAALAMAVGLFVSATFSLPCEGRGFCADLDRFGGYIVLILVPPIAVVAGAWLATTLGRRWIFHAAFAAIVVLVPGVTFLLAELVERNW
jgi:hypothetical protein